MTAKSQLYKADLSIIIILLEIGDDVEAGKQLAKFNAYVFC